jgi:hypothetical protein
MVSHNEELTQDEKSKFAAAFGLQEEQMEMIISCIYSILNECVYYVAKPTLVMKSLMELHMNEELASMISKAWSSFARQMVDNCRKRKALTVKAPAPNQLKNIDYSITVQLGSDHGERVNRKLEPTAIFNLSGEENSAVKDVDPVAFEANSETLYDLFQNLELIQEKLDELKA